MTPSKSQWRDGARVRALRWALPVALLVAEYLFLTFLIDLSGRRLMASRGVELLRMAVPVTIGTAVAAWLVARPRDGDRRPGPSDALPRWRPWPATAANLAAFVLAVGLTWKTLGPDASVPTPVSILGLVAIAALAAVFAAMTAAPAGWLARRARPLVGNLPLAFGVGLVAWWVTVSLNGTWGVLSTATLRTVAAVLEVFGGDVTFLPSEMAVGLGGFEVEVAPNCSGLDGIGLFVLLQAIWLGLGRGRLRPGAWLVLLPVGAVAAFLTNSVRIAALVWVGASGHEALALGGLHSKLGWVLLVALALGSIALAERSPWLRRRAVPAGEAARDDGGVPAEAGAYLGPLVAALATALVTGLWAEGPFDRWYGARIAAAGAVLLALRPSLPSVHPSKSWVPVLVGAGVATAWVAGAGGDAGGLARAVAAMGPIERWMWVLVRFVGSVTVIPLAEELAFRGFLLPWLVSPDVEAVPPQAWTWSAVLLSSLAFGAVHSQIVLGTLAGLAFAYARLRRGRLGDAVVAHAAANAVIALAVLVGDRWDLWR